MNKTGKSKDQLNTVLPPTTLDRLAEYCKIRNEAMTEVVTKAVSDYLQQMEGSKIRLTIEDCGADLLNDENCIKYYHDEYGTVRVFDNDTFYYFADAFNLEDPNAKNTYRVFWRVLPGYDPLPDDGASDVCYWDHPCLILDNNNQSIPKNLIEIIW